MKKLYFIMLLLFFFSNNSPNDASARATSVQLSRLQRDDIDLISGKGIILPVPSCAMPMMGRNVNDFRSFIRKATLYLLDSNFLWCYFL